MVELTVVSHRKAYIFALPATDFLDPCSAALQKELLVFFLTAVRENLLLRNLRVPLPDVESDHPDLGATVTTSNSRYSAKVS